MLAALQTQQAGEIVHEYKRPKGILVRDGSALYVIPANQKEPKVRVLNYPLVCSAVVFDDTKEISGRMLRCFDEYQKAPIEVFCDAATLGRTDAFERFLLKHGVKIAPDEQVLGGRSISSILRSYVLASEPRKHIHLRQLSGWVLDRAGYLLGSEALGPSTAELPETSEKYRSKFSAQGVAFTEAGTIDQWITECARPALQNPVWLTCILSAFAAPLLSLLGMADHGGGFHFFGHSSTGKTIGLKLAASVYGQEFLPWRLTANALEAVAALHSDRVLVLDEIAQAKPRDVMTALYMLANRRGKLRMTEDIQLRTSFTWQLLFLSTGEVSIEDVAAKAKTEYFEGQALRVLSVPFIAKTLPIQTIRNLEDAMQAQQGRVGRAWLNYLMNRKPIELLEWRTLQRNISNEYVAALQTEDPRLIRVVQRLAILETAGCIAHAAGFLPEEFYQYTRDTSGNDLEDHTPIRHALRCVLLSWFESAGISKTGGSLSDTVRASKRLLKEIHKALANRWLVPFTGSTFTTPPGLKVLGFVDESKPDAKRVYLLDAVLQAQCVPPGMRTFTNELAAANVLIRDSKNGNRLKSRMQTISGEYGYRIDSSVHAYCFDLNALENHANA